MATASSVQREPSMEEILASIRRIIEDSDTGRKQPDEADDLLQDLAAVAMPAPEAADAAPEAGEAPPEAAEAPPEVARAAPEAAGSAPEVDAFRAELRPDAGRPVAQAQPSAEPVVARMEPPVRSDPVPVKAPVRLADVSAKVAAGPDAPATARAAETTDSIVADWRREIAAVGEAKAKPDGAEVPLTSDAEPRAEVLEDAAGAFEPASPRSGSARPSAGEAPSARQAILSEHAGRQVAAAFGELSDAFASRSKKTFDEMAEEMLRPMLQDWLDNNLPTLVERLVREEIERVARGAQ